MFNCMIFWHLYFQINIFIIVLNEGPRSLFTVNLQPFSNPQWLIFYYIYLKIETMLNLIQVYILEIHETIIAINVSNF